MKTVTFYREVSRTVIDGVEIIYLVHSKQILSMSNWGKQYDLLQAGHIRSVYFGQLYGHCDFYLTD